MTSASGGSDPNDLDALNDMQRYLVEEEAEKWQQGRITRREFMRRVTLIAGSVVAATPVLTALGCGPGSATPSTPTSTPPSPTAAATPTSAQSGSAVRHRL